MIPLTVFFEIEKDPHHSPEYNFGINKKFLRIYAEIAKNSAVDILAVNLVHKNSHQPASDCLNMRLI